MYVENILVTYFRKSLVILTQILTIECSCLGNDIEYIMLKNII